MWITNGGFAKLFIVFTKISGDKGITAFIVDKDESEIKIGNEEPKMGIKGSSTVQLFFEDCKVPIGNMLGEREQGFKIAQADGQVTDVLFLHGLHQRIGGFVIT